MTAAQPDEQDRRVALHSAAAGALAVIAAQTAFGALVPAQFRIARNSEFFDPTKPDPWFVLAAVTAVLAIAAFAVGFATWSAAVERRPPRAVLRTLNQQRERRRRDLLEYTLQYGFVYVGSLLISGQLRYASGHYADSKVSNPPFDVVVVAPSDLARIAIVLTLTVSVAYLAPRLIRAAGRQFGTRIATTAPA
jgi:hypothetical protein